MAGASAGKFQDHYEILGIEVRASSDVIQRAYATLAQKFHPSNLLSGNKEKFDAINLAYEVLSDPLARRDFDKIIGAGEPDEVPNFSGAGFFEAIGRDALLRLAVLCVLYDRRRSRPFRPSLSVRHIEGLIAATNEEVTLTLWYLKQRGFAAADDKSSLVITVKGMDHIEAVRPSAESVMPYIRSAGAVPETAAQDEAEGVKPQPAVPIATPPPELSLTPPPAKPEPLRNLLNRNLALRSAARSKAV